MTRLRLGTRGSPLALAQSRTVASALEAAGVTVEVISVRTTGDRIADRPLREIGGKGLFTKELDRALLDGDIDLAVHSLKDLPTLLEAGLAMAAVPEREDPRDALVGPAGEAAVALATLPPGARVGTGSLRRRALCLAFRPDLVVVDLRGNLDTRLRKVDEGEVEAIVVAGAGLRRLGLEARIGEWVEGGAWLPAPGQGALAVVARADDAPTLRWLAPLGHSQTEVAVRAERALLRTVEGGCQLPVGALAIPYGPRLRLRGVVASVDGRQVVLGEASGDASDPEGLGERVGAEMLVRGADLVLEQVGRIT